MSCPSCGSPFTAFDRRLKNPRAKYRGLTVANARPAGFCYIIIGNSSAGRAAALAIESLDKDGLVTVISEEDAPLYARPMLPDYIAGLDKDRLHAISDSFPLGRAELIRGDTAVKLDPDAKTVALTSGRIVSYDALLLATGSAPITVPWPGSDTEGIGYFRTLADGEKLLHWAKTATHAVVVGGGLLGLEFVRAFHTRKLPVTQLVRETRVGAPALDEQAGAVLARALDEWGVNLVLEDEVDHFEAANGRVSAVLTKKGQRIACDLVGVAVGARPRVELAQQAGLALDRGILVDARFETSIPGIYAAGDAAQAFDRSWGVQKVNTSWRNAREQGEFAGICMAGGAGEYAGGLAANYQLAAGLPFCALGISNPPDPAGFEIEARQDLPAKTYRKLVRRDGVLAGVCLVGNLDEAAALEQQLGAAPAVTSETAPAFTPKKTETTSRQGEAEPPPVRSMNMRKMTEENAKASFAGESQAHIKYLNFAQKADKEGKGNIARLFRAASYAEQVHAGRHLVVLNGIGGTAENVAEAAGGESFEVAEMYPAYIVVADEQEESAASESFTHAMKAEIQHHDFYVRAKQALDAGGDANFRDIFVCPYCGCTLEGAAPDKCPVCSEPGKNFVKF
jgi:NADPH-dependent 2,4-dienoyl-CoA reductase/sulfur reductase-like enzyme/rubrerythrin